jgi:hypothetical protein
MNYAPPIIMSSIHFGNLLQLMLTELADTVQKSETQATAARVRLDDIELDIPAHLQLLEAEAATPAQLIVGMPSPREVLPAGRVGRIRVTFEAQRPEPTAQAPDPAASLTGSR